jgi:hypothetical protein
MSDLPPSRGERPEYTVYRSRPRLLRRGDGNVLDELRHDEPGHAPDHAPRRVRRRPRVGRILRYAVLGLIAWLLVSGILFMVSAQIQRQGIADAADGTLDSAGFTLTSREHRPHPRLRPAHEGDRRARIDHLGPVASGLDHAHAPRRRRERDAVHSA